MFEGVDRERLMGLFGSIVSVNIPKLILKGDIAKAYEKMYNLAETLAVHEVKLYQTLTTTRTLKKYEDKNRGDIMGEVLDKVAIYRQKRIQYHISEMKELLKLREKLLESKE